MADPLLEPFQLRHLSLRNRVFSSAHEPAYGVGGMPTERYRRYHEEKAKGGVGLTMTAGSAVVSRDSPPGFGNLHAWDDAIVPWIRQLTDSVHEHGAACMIQLTHLGRRSGWSHADWLPVVAPSSLRESAHRAHPKAAEEWDIDRIVDDYAAAAERMAEGGMDGIEIESYGHFFDQWWSPLTNHRRDEFGGDLAGRMEVPLRILRRIRERVGPDFIVGLRMSLDETTNGGLDAEQGLTILRRVDELGLIDFVNVIRGRIDSDSRLSQVIPIHGTPAAPHLAFAGEVKRSTDLAVLHASKIDDVATARYAIDEGLLDLVGMTRAQMADPHLVNKIAEGREAQIRPCVGATYCLDRIYEGGEALCIHNAATSREETFPHVFVRSASPIRVVIVGAGPAGLEAARLAGESGHEVVVFEAMAEPGGQLRLAARNPRRVDLMGIIDWRVAELDRHGVDVRYNTLADADMVRAEQPDVVIVATGAWPKMPNLASGSELIASSWDVIGGSVTPKGRVLLFDDDGTHSALTAAEQLARSGVQLEVVTPERMYGIEVGGMNAVGYANALTEADVRITLQQRLLAVRREGSELCATIGSETSTKRHERIVDHVVVDVGAASIDDLYFELVAESTNLGALDHAAFIAGEPQQLLRNESGDYKLFRIGDAVAGRNVHAAMYDALRLVKGL